MQLLHDRQKKIEEDLSMVPPPSPHIHPNLVQTGEKMIANLIRVLNDPNTLIKAKTVPRQLIGRVQLGPENGELAFEL